jgi:ribose transport system permease protein
VIYAISQWHTEGRQVVGELPEGFLDINSIRLFGEIPLPAVYLLVITLVLWVVLDYTPIGRFLYATGANPRAALLNGIPVRRYVIGAFMTSGFLCAFAGVVLASKLRIGQSVVGLEFLLPALVGAFLGSTTIRPGRVNVWGTVVGIGVLSVGIAGIQRYGSDFFVEPLFNGLTLIIAVSIAGYAGRKRLSATRSREPGTTTTADTAPEAAGPRRE